MARLFTVDGTCAQYDLDSLLSEAKAMLANSLTAIDAIKNAKIFLSDSDKRHFMRNARNSFGTAYLGKSGSYTAADKVKLDFVRANLQTISDALTTGSIQPPSNWLSCSDDSYDSAEFQYQINKAEKDLTVTILEKTGFANLWYIPNHLAGDQERVFVTPKPGITGKPCTAPNLPAVTYTPNILGLHIEPRQIILCPRFFDTTIRLIDLKAVRAAPKTAPSVTGSPSTNIDAYKSWPGSWIHELFHLLLGNGYRDDDFYYDNTDTEQNPYDRVAIFAVANQNSKCKSTTTNNAPDPLKLPDAYRIFIESCYLNSIKFDTENGGLPPLKLAAA
ncbi:hypothetical protein LTR17_008694 [Elasticomyces elasticus]|nr:hypothetical protein LTR17_008694 [Elasticomyces elasticus]